MSSCSPPISASSPLIAFDKSFLARPIGGGVTSLGIPVGVGLILLAILLTGLYVRRAKQGICHSRWSMTHAARRRDRRPAHERRSRRTGNRPIGRDPMFAGFVALTLGDHRAGRRGARARVSDFYTAGGTSPASRTGWRWPATICRRPRFSASPRRSSTDGYDGLIYAIGFLVGWPIILFLIANGCAISAATPSPMSPPSASRRRRCAASRRSARCSSSLFYLIAQMVGAGQLIQLLFGLPYSMRRDHRRAADDRSTCCSAA